MNASAAVLAVVLVEAAVGGLALLWFLPTWGKLRHGYEILLGSTLTLMAWGGWAALQGPLSTVTGVGDATVWVSRGLAATTLLGAAAVIVLILPPISDAVAPPLGMAATITGLLSFLPLAALRQAGAESGGVTAGVIELVLGAFLLGAIWNGLVLGHWYLVERRLSNRYMLWLAWANVAAVVAGVGAVALSARNPVPCAGLTGAEAEACAFSFSPLLSVGNMTIVMGLGVLALLAVIAGVNVRLAREGGRSIQAATGMFYLAVVLAPAVEFAAKVRFF